MFTVGPVEVHPEILNEMSKPMVGHRTKECYELYASIKSKLQELLYTKNRCFIFASSSSGVMEAAVRNCVKERCLNLVNGAFSERWHKMTLANGKAADKLEFEWGLPINPEKLDEALATGKYDAVTFIHNETSTGVMSNISDIANVMKKYPSVIFLVDTVSSMTALPIKVDELGIDICLAGVQKAFALPPGMAVASISEKAIEKAKTVENRGYYFDILELLKYYEKDQYPSTPPISLMYALNKQLDRMFAEGVENRFKRHENMATLARTWAKNKGFKLYPKVGYESITLTCVNHEGKVDYETLSSMLAEKNMTISKGYGKDKDTTFRIGHMGDISEEDLKELLRIMDEILAKHNIEKEM